MKQQEAVVKGGAETWRVGLKVPLNVYEGDRPVCQCHQPEDAERIVAAMNARREFEANWAANHAQYDAEIARLTESNTKLMGAARALRESNALLVGAAQNLLAAIVMRGSITGSRAYADLCVALTAAKERANNAG